MYLPVCPMEWSLGSDISNFLGGIDDDVSRKHYFILRLLKHMPKVKGEHNKAVGLQYKYDRSPAVSYIVKQFKKW